MSRTVLAVAAAFAFSPGAALANGGASAEQYESTQPHPHFTQAEIAANANPFSWIGRLFQGPSSQNTATVSPKTPVGSGTAVHG